MVSLILSLCIADCNLLGLCLFFLFLVALSENKTIGYIKTIIKLFLSRNILIIAVRHNINGNYKE